MTTTLPKWTMTPAGEWVLRDYTLTRTETGLRDRPADKETPK